MERLVRKIKIRREAGNYGRIRKLKLLVDGKTVASINQGELIELEIPDDASVLCGKMDWGKTKPLSLIEIKEGDLVTFKPYFTLNLLRSLAIMSIPIEISVQ